VPYAWDAVWRYSPWDGLLVALSAMHGVALLTVPSVPVVAVGLWWTANTVAHNFLHRPFFRSRRLNRAYALFLSALLGFPQSLWRARHLAHHAGRRVGLRLPRGAVIEGGLVAAAWGAATFAAPGAFVRVYLPGWALGLALCHLQGRYEHRHGTTSHHGRLYNLLFFNDGRHLEHHCWPGRHWTRLGTQRTEGRVSRWPPVLRWLDGLSLEGLERLVLRSPRLQRMVVDAHARAFARLLPAPSRVRSVVVVGGGLFPRTALVLRRLLPDATVTIVDADADHLEIAGRFLGDSVERRQELFSGVAPPGVDLVVVPLAYIGDRRRLYDDPPAPVTLVHDWIWSRHGRGAAVSWLLLKRVNCVRQVAQPAAGSATRRTA
jgi:hypothetical protein